MGFVTTFFRILFEVLSLLILARVILSWVDRGGSSQVSQIIYELTEPILGPIRSIMPAVGMFDFSPIIALLLLRAIQQALFVAFGGGG